MIWEAYQRELGSIPGENLLSLSLSAASNQERPEQNAEEEWLRDVLPPSADYYSSAKNNPALHEGKIVCVCVWETGTIMFFRYQ